MEPGSGTTGSKLCQVSDAPMFCTYSQKYKGRNFVMAVRAGVVRDERILEVMKKDKFLKIAQAVYIPPESYIKEKLSSEPLPHLFSKVFGEEIVNIDHSEAKWIPEFNDGEKSSRELSISRGTLMS